MDNGDWQVEEGLGTIAQEDWLRRGNREKR
jgi:hypothetical protein